MDDNWRNGAALHPGLLRMTGLLETQVFVANLCQITVFVTEREWADEDGACEGWESAAKDFFAVNFQNEGVAIPDDAHFRVG